MLNSQSSEVVAGLLDEARAILADASRQPDCLHAKPKELVHLVCRFCGVYILSGKVIDMGRSQSTR